jgi:pimeloyl-ACP methyl ester carboxylesterase
MVPERIHALGFFHSKAGADNASKIDDRKRAMAAASQSKDLYLATMLRNTLAEGHVAQFQHELNDMIEAAQHDITSDCIVAAHSVMIERPDNVEYLKNVAFPLYYFLGMQDKSIPYEQIKPELESLPEAHIQIIENAGHMGQIECKSDAVEWIRSMCMA